MIIWIASYPKSGNTWVRLFLEKYYECLGKKFTTYTFPKIEDLIKLKVDFKNFIELAKNWENLQNSINLDSKTKFLKTHNALCTINGHKFTSKNNSLGAIYIVRDPRDVLVSYSNHLGQSEEKVLRGMLDPQNGELGEHEGFEWKKSIMGKWSDHYNSWKNFGKDNFIIIKYEKLKQNPEEEFFKIINLLNHLCEIKVDKFAILTAIKETSFEKLKKKEELSGFQEATENGPFFRKGIVGDWKNSLNKETVDQIEKKFEKEMKELGYLS